MYAGVGGERNQWQVRLLQEARDVLSDPEKKTLYDKWRGSGIAIGFKQWTAMKDSVQQVCHNKHYLNFAFTAQKLHMN